MNGPRRSGLYLAELLLFYLASLGAAVTGLALAWLRYLATPTDPFSPLPEGFPLWQHAHLLVVPALSVGLGLLWARHAHAFFKADKPRKRTGLTLVWVGLVMIFSGSLYQVAAGEGPRALWRATHALAGVLWLALLALHLVGKKPSNGR